jgi:hypothetical protein
MAQGDKPSSLAAYGVSQPLGAPAPAAPVSSLSDFGTTQALPSSTSDASAPPAHPAGVVARSLAGAGEVAKGVANAVVGAVHPPTTPTESMIAYVGGDPSLFAYRASKAVGEAAERVAQATPGEFEQAKADFKKAVDDFHNKNYRAAATDVASGAAGIGDIANPIAPPGRELTEATRPGGNLAGPLTRDAIIAGSAVLPEILPKIRFNPFRNPAADMGEAAVRGGVDSAATTQGVPRASAGRAILNATDGGTTVVDEPLQSLATKEKAAYKRLDDASGFDLKAAKDQLKLDQRAAKQPGVTPENLKTIQNRIADTTDHITQAEKNLTDQGIDPKEGDRIHTARMAGQDFKAKLIQSTDDAGNVDVDKLLAKGKMLRFSKYGDRLTQFMGKEGADAFMNDLQDAQKAGIKSVNRNVIAGKIAKWVGGAVVTGAAGAAGYEAVKHVLQ